LYCHRGKYAERKSIICASPLTNVIHKAYHDGTVVELLHHPRHGAIYADDSVEIRHALLTTLLTTPARGTIIPPWTMPLDDIAPEEYFTPNPTSFPDDILAHLSTSPEEARAAYITDLETHVTPQIRNACPAVMDLLTSSLALDVFVPESWLGIKMLPYHLEIKPGLPDHIKAHTRPVREALYQDAKKEFDRMRTWFYESATRKQISPALSNV
jgi:hypothetical protein